MLIGCSNVHGQKVDVKKLTPSPKNYDNIHIQKIAEDTFQSSYVVWVKEQVKSHYHDHHSEYIHVLDGRAIMRLDSSNFTIQKGDVIFIPQKSIQDRHHILVPNLESLPHS